MVPGLELVAVVKQQPLALGAFLAPLAGVIAVALGDSARCNLGSPQATMLLNTAKR